MVLIVVKRPEEMSEEELTAEFAAAVQLRATAEYQDDFAAFKMWADAADARLAAANAEVKRREALRTAEWRARDGG